MTRLWLSLLIIVGAMLCLSPVHANGEPTGEYSNTGVIVPIDEAHAAVVDQKINITMPTPKGVMEPTQSGYGQPALVRVEYTLQNTGDKPLTINIGWPTSGVRFKPAGEEYHLIQQCVPAVKLDGKPIAAEFLTFQALIRQLEQPWRDRIDKLLSSKPALKERVLAIRKESQKYDEAWIQSAGRGKLANWMEQNRMKAGDRRETEVVAAGLLGGAACANSPIAYCTQSALEWLDPGFQRVDAYEVLSQRWGHKSLLLDPYTKQLTQVFTLDKQSFGLFRFPITLRPEEQHRLIVQYGQFLGGNWNEDWYGMVYLMEPARRWGSFNGTTIEIRVPTGWKLAAIRPPAAMVSEADGYATYRIVIDHVPLEDLWISIGDPEYEPKQTYTNP